jgi:competence ComEA-like helix-hairpin-helix protein
MSTTPQERLALGVAALLLAAGVGARALRSGPEPAELTGGSTVEADARGLAALRDEVRGEVARAERRARPLAPGEKIDPNTASADELDRLPKVGPGAAEKIVAWRQEHGRFRTLADLDSVPGIGPAALAAIAPHVTLPAAAGGRAALGGPVQNDAPRGSAAGSPRASPASPAGAVDLNAASAAELEALPGIGPSLAGRIVAWRAAHGRFRSVDELEQVAGVGPATLARIRPHVRASP